MEDEAKTKEQLMAELEAIRQRVAELEAAEINYKRAEEALRESEEHYHTLFEQAADAIVLVDTHSRALVEFNDRAHENLGYTREEFEKLTIPDFEIIESPEEYVGHVGKIIREGFDVFETKHRRKGGEIRNILVSARTISLQGELFVQSIWRDVTERRQTEEALRETEKFQRTLLETSPDFIFVLDANSTILRVNRVQPGHREEDVVGQRASTFVPPEYRDAFERAVRKAADTRQLQTVETMVDLPDGRHYILNRLNPVDLAGVEGSVVLIATDITERRQAQEEASYGRDLLQTLLNNVPDYVYFKDRDRRFVRASNAFCDLFKCDLEDIIGKADEDLFPAEVARETVSDDRRVMETGIPIINKEEGGESIGGEEHWVLTTKLPWYDKAGNIVGLFGISKEITERKQAEEDRTRLSRQIEEQAWQVRQIMDTVPEGVLLLDTTGRIILTNPVAEGALSVLVDAQAGDTLTHLGGRPLAELLTSPPKGLWHEVVADGRAFEIIARPVESGLEASDWVLVIRDVTQEREVQQRAQRRDRLASVGQLAAGIAHDFNNMLTTIMLYAQILRGHRYLPSDMVPGLETILNETRRATDLVGQILDFSRSSPIETHPVDLRAFVKETVNILEHTIREDIRLRLDLKAERCTVAADPTRLQQVMMNLVINARDAMPGGGELTFTLDRVELNPGQRPPVAEMPPGEWVCIAVSDTGAGIAPEALSHIFEPFFTTKAPGQGTGLGLAQVYGIVKQHNGYIGVKTKVGQGTTFLVYLPAHDEESAEVEHKEAPSAVSGEGETILLVEDEQRLRDSARQVLESVGYRVLAAADGREALKVYVEAERVDLVITDLVMPNMGGEELIQELRQTHPTLKALAITGYVTEDDLPRLMKAGFMDVIWKPFDIDTLMTAARNALGSRRSKPGETMG